MKKSTFTTYEDISTDENVKDLHVRKRTVLVRSTSSRLTRRPDNMTVVDMREEVELARFVYAKNLSYRFGLTDAEGNDVKKLPSTTVFAAILHPLFPAARMVGSSLLTLDQWKYGIDSLIDEIETRYEKDSPDEIESDGDDDELQMLGYVPKSHNKSDARDKATTEVMNFIKNYKKIAALPKYKPNSNTRYLHGTESNTINDDTIVLWAEVEEKGTDLPSGRNLANYITKEGKFKHIQFWVDHSKKFPKLWSFAVERASCNPTEVSCETLFSESGYASTARNTKLSSRQFEREVSIARNIQVVYFDIEHAVDVFLARKKKGDWDEDEEARDALFYMEQERDLFIGRGSNNVVVVDNEASEESTTQVG